MSTDSDRELIVASIQRDLERWKIAHDDRDLVAAGRIKARMIQSYIDLGMINLHAQEKVDTLLSQRIHGIRILVV